MVVSGLVRSTKWKELKATFRVNGRSGQRKSDHGDSWIWNPEGSNSDLYHENDMFVFVVLKETSIDTSTKIAGLEGSWLGGKEFFYWEASNLIQWEIASTWTKGSSVREDISKGKKWERNWMWIQQSLVASWSSRAVDSCPFHVEASPAHDWLLTGQAGYPDTVRNFCWSVNRGLGIWCYLAWCLWSWRDSSKQSWGETLIPCPGSEPV